MGDACKYAVVTGANKGIGFETVKQLVNSGVMVALTARNEKRGMEATSLLNEQGFLNVVFHQLDVQDDQSIQSLAEFVQTQYGRLDVLVNNAGAVGMVPDEDVLRDLNIDLVDWNSPSPRIVNVSSRRGALNLMPNEERIKELGDIENLTEDKIDKILQTFMHDVKQDSLEVNGWQMMLPAYSMSKVSLNAYTRILARRFPKMCINCVHPGFVNTDISWHRGPMPVEEGAAGPVMLALLPDGGPTGCYFDRTVVTEF